MFNREKPLVSIVIPSWFTENQNGKYGKNETYWFANECLKRLIQVTDKSKYELIIIDNGSSLKSDENGESIDQYWKSADVLIVNKENLGFAPACNQGFALSRGKYICCLNNDILLWSGWLEEMLKTFELDLNPKVGVVMPALIVETSDANEALKIESPSLKRNYGIVGPGAEFGSLWISSKEVFDKLIAVDGFIFDENFKLGFGEDRDLWDRIRDIGYETYRTHNVRVYHVGNMSIKKIKNRKEFTEKNHEYLEEKRKIRQEKYVKQ
jgi:GT2 family glycosyltransferase